MRAGRDVHFAVTNITLICPQFANDQVLSAPLSLPAIQRVASQLQAALEKSGASGSAPSDARSSAGDFTSSDAPNSGAIEQLNANIPDNGFVYGIRLSNLPGMTEIATSSSGEESLAASNDAVSSLVKGLQQELRTHVQEWSTTIQRHMDNLNRAELRRSSTELSDWFLKNEKQLTSDDRVRCLLLSARIEIFFSEENMEGEKE